MSSSASSASPSSASSGSSPRSKHSMDATILKVEASRTGLVSEVSDFLHALDQLYQSLDQYLMYMNTVELSTAPKVKLEYLEYLSSDASLRLLNASIRPSSLALQSVVIQSPGEWQFLGALSPLTFIRDFLNDLHSRRKDNEYRNREEERRLRHENERRQLENEELFYKIQREALVSLALHNHLLQEDIKLMTSLGFPQDRIDALVANHFLNPCARLSRFTHEGLVGQATLAPYEPKPK